MTEQQPQILPLRVRMTSGRVTTPSGDAMSKEKGQPDQAALR
jgi:hypothetical protein